MSGRPGIPVRAFREFAEKYGARNANGEFYLYGGSHYMEDLLNPACLDRCQ